jgi:hypothetical protein
LELLLQTRPEQHCDVDEHPLPVEPQVVPAVQAPLLQV